MPVSTRELRLSEKQPSYDQPAATGDEVPEALGAGRVTVVTISVVRDTYDVTSVAGSVGAAVVDSEAAGTTVVGITVVDSESAVTAVVGVTVVASEGSDAGEVVTPFCTELTGADNPAGAAVDDGVEPPTGTPHCPRRLLPGNLARTPSTCSSIGHWILHEVLGSLTPPISPGHLSIPLSPALQLSMICCSVVLSQPEI
jgi:hypothetical protein